MLVRFGLRFRKINQDDPVQISARIKALETINLKYYNINAILLITRNSFSIPVNIWPQIKGHFFYRSQICPKDNPFITKSRISYNPSPGGSIGRANLPFRSAFYASSAIDTAAIEACQEELRKTSKREFDLVIGMWELTKDIEAVIICHSEETQNVGTDMKEAVEAIEPLMHEGKTEEQFQAVLKANVFYSKQFSKKEIKNPHSYLFSALCANTIMNSKDPELSPESLWYPSVAYKYKGFNVLFKNQLIDNSELILSRVYHYRLNFDNPDSYPQISVIKEAARIDKDNLIW